MTMQAAPMPVNGPIPRPVARVLTPMQEIEAFALDERTRVVAVVSVPIVGGAVIGSLLYGAVGAGIGAFIGVCIPAYILTHIGFSK